MAWPDQTTAVRSPTGQVQAGLLQVPLQVVFGMGILPHFQGKQGGSRKEPCWLGTRLWCVTETRWDGSKSCFLNLPALKFHVQAPVGHLGPEAELGDGNTAALPAGPGIRDKSLQPCPPGQKCLTPNFTGQEAQCEMEQIDLREYISASAGTGN